jgi:hypothetical protein
VSDPRGTQANALKLLLQLAAPISMRENWDQIGRPMDNISISGGYRHV